MRTVRQDARRFLSAPAARHGTGVDGLLLELVAELRIDLPQLGTRKLLHLLAPGLGDCAPQVGCDYLRGTVPQARG